MNAGFLIKVTVVSIRLIHREIELRGTNKT